MSEPINIKGPEEFKSKVLDSEIPVLVDFWAPWCMPCRLMTPVLEKMSIDFDGKMLVAKVNTEETENQQLAYFFQIMSIPNMKMFDKGKIAHEFIGFRPEDQLKKEISDIISKD